MYKRIVFLFFLMLLSSVFSADLAGFKNYSAVTDNTEKTVTFVLEPETDGSSSVFFYSDFIYVINPEPEFDYFVKLSDGFILMPCTSGDYCSFIGASPLTEIVFGPEISGLILDNSSINLKALNNNAVDLVVHGDLTVKNSASIISSGSIGGNGTTNTSSCSSTTGGNAGLSANIKVNGITTLSENSVLTFDSSGSNGGNGVDGFSSGSCENYDATNGGNAASGGQIELGYLILLDSSNVSFVSFGGTGGTGGKGMPYTDDQGQPAEGSDGRQGFGGSAGKITINNFSLAFVNNPPEISFNAVKGTGVTSDDLFDGVVSIKGCNLKSLIFSSCNAERIKILSNDSLDLLETPACVSTQTPVQPKLNCDCYSTTGLTSLEVIFSLTGTAKTFIGEPLSGNLKNFALDRDLIDSTQKIKSDSGQYSFSDGFFNFSFGKNKQIFSDLELGLGPFTYLFSFLINALNPVVLSDSQETGFKLIDYQEQGCGST